MIEQLFGSKTRVKLLQLFLSNPNRSFYVREITRKIDEQINSVRRELANLLSIGIISSDTNNNRLYYEVNQDYEHFGSLASIFGAASPSVSTNKSKQKKQPATKTASSQPDEFKNLGNVDIALYSGQFTRDNTAGVDFLVVGDINQTQLNKYVDELEKKEGKEITFAVLTLNDFNYRRQVKDRFISNVMAAKKQILVDKHNLLTESGKE